MTAPERIYLTTNKSDGEWSNVSQRTVPDWLSKHVDEHQYIRADIHEAEINALKAELAALKAPPKVLSVQEVKEPGCYWWRREENTDWSVQNVYLPGAGKLLVGQFIGPIPKPEVCDD